MSRIILADDASGLLAVQCRAVLPSISVTAISAPYKRGREGRGGRRGEERGGEGRGGRRGEERGGEGRGESAMK